MTHTMFDPCAMPSCKKAAVACSIYCHDCGRSFKIDNALYVTYLVCCGLPDGQYGPASEEACKAVQAAYVIAAGHRRTATVAPYTGSSTRRESIPIDSFVEICNIRAEVPHRPPTEAEVLLKRMVDLIEGGDAAYYMTRGDAMKALTMEAKALLARTLRI